MKANHKIIVFGTSHPLQCGTIKHSDEQINAFRNRIVDICKFENVKCIFEEMSCEGLANHNVNNTIAFEIANDRDIKHSYIDLTPEQRTCFGVSDGQIVGIAMNQESNAQKNEIRQLLTKKLLDPIRERYWLVNILENNMWPTLFICGSDHGQAMQDLINSIGYGPILSWEKYCPEKIVRPYVN